MIASLQDLAQEVDGLKYSSHASSILDSENMTEAVVALKNNKVSFFHRYGVNIKLFMF